MKYLILIGSECYHSGSFYQYFAVDICPNYHNSFTPHSVQHKSICKTLVPSIMFADWAVETRDIMSKKFAKSTEDATQLQITHPFYGSHSTLIFDVVGIQVDRSNPSRCFVHWKNTSIRDHTCWFPFNLETSENIADLECSFPDYREKLVNILPENPRDKKRCFDETIDHFANEEIIRQVNSLVYLYSHARSTRDHLLYLGLATFLGFLHDKPRKINTTGELQHMVVDIFEHDTISRDFLMEVVTHFVRIEGDSCENHEVHKRLKTIHGVGDVRASELVRLGIQDVDDLRDMLTQNRKIVPPTVTRILPFHEDLQKRIPRREVESIAHIVCAQGKTIWQDLHAEVLGSYSRGARSCGDVDMLITSPSVPSMNSSDYIERIKFLHTLVNSLKSTGVLIETMSMTKVPKTASPSVKGSVMFMGIVRIAGICRHIDIKIFPHNLLPFCQLHFVGNYRFSKALRWYTKQKGYRLSELGLRPVITPGSEEDSETDLEDSDIKPHRVDRIKTEQDTFYALRLKYVPPNLRQLS